MPDNRKHVIVEPETHEGFMQFTVENAKPKMPDLTICSGFINQLKKQIKNSTKN